MRFFINCLLAVAIYCGGPCCTPRSTEWKLVWSDEFDYEGVPDPARWSFDTTGNSWGWGNNEMQHYTSMRSENASVEDGVLKITACIDSMEGKRYTSARLITKGKGEWIYGRIEVRAKLPAGRGVWPAIWMLPSGDKYGVWPAGGEIDIMEHVGFEPDSIYATAHTQRFNHINGTSHTGAFYMPSASEAFHTFALEWEPDEWRAYVDGQHYYTWPNDGQGFASWPFDEPFYLIINLAVGGNWGGKMGIDDSGFPKTMEVDYVRIYQKQE